MNTRLQADIGESRKECLYARNCPILTNLRSRSFESVSEMYETVCTTEKKYDCTQFQMMEARALSWPQEDDNDKLKRSSIRPSGHIKQYIMPPRFGGWK